MKSKLIGKKVEIKTKGDYFKEWGIVKHFDGEYYYIAIANGDNLPVFDLIILLLDCFTIGLVICS